MKITLAAVVVVLLTGVLGSCASAVSGRGAAASRPSTSSTDSSNAPLIRVPQTHALGDPVRVDLCADLNLATFKSWGDPGLDEWQPADYCVIDVQASAKDSFTLSIGTAADDGIYAGQPNTRTSVGNYLEYLIPSSDGECDRIFIYSGLELIINALTDQGSVSQPTLCKAAQALVDDESAALHDGLPPSRTVALPTVTRFDPCGLLEAGGVLAVPGVSQATVTADEGGAECIASGASMSIDLSYVFVAVDYDYNAKTVTVGGHPELIDQGLDISQECRVQSVQGITTDQSSREVIDVEADNLLPQGGNSKLCSTVEKLTADVLTKAGLH